jgi:tetratricopeptide (TPR) repeat protein
MMALDDRRSAREALERAYALSDRGDHAASQHWARRASEIDPTLADAHTMRGWALENLGSIRLPEAKAAYEEALRLDPSDLWAVLGLATVVGRLGDGPHARILYARCVDEAPACLDDEQDLYEVLSWSHYKLGHVEDAIAVCREGLSRNADWPSLRLDMALMMLVSGEVEEALRAYTVGAAAAGSEQLGIVAVAFDDLELGLAEHPDVDHAAGDRARGILARALGLRASPG